MDQMIEAAEREMDVLHDQIMEQVTALDALREQVTVLQGAYDDLAKISINDVEKIDTARNMSAAWKHSATTWRNTAHVYINARDAAQAELHAERNQQQRTIATKCLSVMEENARLLNALTIVTPALEAAMEMLQEDEAMPFVRTLGYCILLLEEKAAPPDGDVTDPTHGGGLSPLDATKRARSGADTPSETE